MKLFFFSILLSVLFAACNVADQKPQIANPTAFDAGGFEMTEVEGGAQKAVKKNADGRTLEEGVVQNGKRHGIWVTYHNDRPLPRIIASYVAGKLTGPYFEYSPHGQVELVCGYLENKLDGAFARYKMGRKTEEGFYKNGLLEGVCKKYYGNKDHVQQETHFQNGLMHGTHRFYSETGEVMLEYEYKNGEKQ